MKKIEYAVEEKPYKKWMPVTYPADFEATEKSYNFLVDVNPELQL